MGTKTQAELLLRKQPRELSKYPLDMFSAGLVTQGNPFEWDVIIFGLQGTIYEGGIFPAKIFFAEDYPNNPPTVKFTTQDMWHPNVYLNGTVSMSILSPPGDDPYGYELASERWLSVHTVESIVLGVVSLLWEPNDEAAANEDAVIEWRERRDVFTERVLNLVRRSQCRFMYGDDYDDTEFDDELLSCGGFGATKKVDQFLFGDPLKVYPSDDDKKAGGPFFSCDQVFYSDIEYSGDDDLEADEQFPLDDDTQGGKLLLSGDDDSESDQLLHGDEDAVKVKEGNAIFISFGDCLNLVKVFFFPSYERVKCPNGRLHLGLL
ncbi:OLC1v1020283C1 [Oldenlandia corymbosa var. corymbosa]|uniref:OLC1v1020283C1 n=1 Tax=Oldenlandia corymbosa var. corymbosa TaxID=529605 RepID=A0AAV1EG23_OLDCO|nr:OLC1v1020283C1 [Oldenlandia corymbosa var. corymbosa]